MKQHFGAKLARSCLLWMPWIAANYGIRGAASAWPAGEDCWPTIAMNEPYCALPSTIAVAPYLRSSATAKRLSPARHSGLPSSPGAQSGGEKELPQCAAAKRGMSQAGTAAIPSWRVCRRHAQHGYRALLDLGPSRTLCQGSPLIGGMASRADR